MKTDNTKNIFFWKILYESILYENSLKKNRIYVNILYEISSTKTAYTKSVNMITVIGGNFKPKKVDMTTANTITAYIKADYI